MQNPHLLWTLPPLKHIVTERALIPPCSPPVTNYFVTLDYTCTLEYCNAVIKPTTPEDAPTVVATRRACAQVTAVL